VIARLSVAVCFACLLAVVIAAAVKPHFSYGLGLSTCATAVLGIAGGLTYLRSTSGRRPWLHITVSPRVARFLVAAGAREVGDGPRPLADEPLPCPDGCEHPLTVHSADLGCWLCDCTHGREVAR
jgi:hypothetical protein